MFAPPHQPPVTTRPNHTRPHHTIPHQATPSQTEADLQSTRGATETKKKKDQARWPPSRCCQRCLGAVGQGGVHQRAPANTNMYSASRKSLESGKALVYRNPVEYTGNWKAQGSTLDGHLCNGFIVPACAVPAGCEQLFYHYNPVLPINHSG